MMLIRCYVAIALVSACVASREQALIDWVVSLGGTVNAEVKANSAGVRGLFATRDIPQFSPILLIPSDAILNVGGPDFESPILNLLRELHSEGGSRFQPYLDALPPRGAVLNGCNLPAEYVPMLQSDIWEEAVLSWHRGLAKILSGEDDAHHALTLPEALGSSWRNITLEDLQYACALTATRDVVIRGRSSFLLVPLYDMMNHEAGSPHYLQPLPAGYDQRGLLIMAGRDVAAGEELTYDYLDSRDDFAFVHYGFALPLEGRPPRLWMVDHPGSSALSFAELDQHYLQELPDLFEGTPDEMYAEAERLWAIWTKLQELDAQPPPEPTVPGGEYAYQWLIELQRRRRTAIVHEIDRLQALLKAAAETQQGGVSKEDL